MPLTRDATAAKCRALGHPEAYADLVFDRLEVDTGSLISESAFAGAIDVVDRETRTLFNQIGTVQLLSSPLAETLLNKWPRS